MRQFYNKYQRFWPAGFFIGGFIFDLLTTDRIDQSFSLVQQFIYILLIMIFFYWEIVTPRAFQDPSKFLGRLWPYHVEALHFLFGSLLSLYTIFYFKSASLVNSFLFMMFLAGVLVINELPSFQKRGWSVRASLLSLCLTSYLIYLVPVLTGALGLWAFFLAMVLSGAILGLFVMQLLKFADGDQIQSQIVLPAFFIQVAFVVLYFFKVLPPVPISLKHIGIYHEVEKQNGQYVLRYERSWWRVWESGAQTFIKRRGDKLYCFVSIFSPTDFTEKVNLVWYKKTKKAWTKRDQVPLEIRGGRNQGFRGYVYKSNFEPGDWRVKVKTSDGREVGRISFTVYLGPEKQNRDFKQELL